MLHTITSQRVSSELDTARALYDIGDYSDALRAVSLVIERSDDPSGKLAALLLKACIEWRQGDLVASLKTLNEGGPLVDLAPADLRGKYFGQRALAHRGLGETDAALVDYEQARDCAHEVGNLRTEASIRNNIAVIYNESGRRDEALRELECAARVFSQLHDDLNLGNCYDTRAQILISMANYNEALRYSEKAVRLLADDPSLDGALAHHGLAMIGVGLSHLRKPESIEAFNARHTLAQEIDTSLSSELIESALKRSNGHVLGAAKMLHVSHSVLIKLIAKYNLERVPKRRREKTLTKKINSSMTVTN